MLTQFGAALVGMCDLMMVGHYSTTDLAAVSFSNAIFFTAMVFAMGVLMSVTPLISQEVGHKQQFPTDQEQCETHIASLLQNGVWVTLLLCALMLFILGNCIAILDSFGQDPVVVEAARPYFILIVISLVPFLFFCLQKQFLEGLGNTTAAMVITVVMNGLNIFLNWIFIFGHLGTPALGATGAGIATLISRLLMPFCFTAVIWFKKDWRKYVTAFSARLNNLHEIRKLLHVGIPIGGQTLLETITFTASFIFVGWLSKEALAAHQIANQIADLTFMLALGIGSATTIRVSYQLGRKDIPALRMAARASVHLVLLMNTIGAGLMIGCRHWIPYMFTKDPLVIDIASRLILLAGLLQYADGLQCVGASMLRGITDVHRPMIYAFVAYIVVALPVGLYCMFPLGLGAEGIWVGFIAGLSMAAILFHLRFNRQIRKIEAG